MQRITTQHQKSQFVFYPLAVITLLMTFVITTHTQAWQASQATSPLAATFEAHGGLDRFQSFGTMAYTMKGFPLSAPMAKTNRSTVDLKTRRNRIDGEGFTVAWDGERAWSTPGPDAVGLPPRFVTLGSFYFIGMPFVFGDDGVVLEEDGYGTFRGTTYRVVNVSYKPGVGYTSEDEFTVFINPETDRIALIHHSVTENPDIDRVTWTFDEFQEVEGLLLPAKMTFYAGWNPDNPVAPGTGASFTIEDVKLDTRRPKASLYKAPADAVIDGSTDDD
ncbi:MAG: hypothetical protein IID30_14315 [Planctomycetes bacterium]|nr:hypothetical protein [Planctomycetota bacterium]